MTVVAPVHAAEEGKFGKWSAPFWEGGADAFDPPSFDTARRFPTAGTAIALPDGRLLYWNALEGSENADLWLGAADGTIPLENSRARLLDLRPPQPAWTKPVLERGRTADGDAKRATHDLFCSDQKLLYDGKVLVAGGSRWDVAEDTNLPEPRGVKDTSVFEPETNSFRAVADMREPRWYPSLVTLADGRVSVSSGVRRAGYTFESSEASFSQVRLTEVYDPTTERWEDGGKSRSSFPLYPRLHLTPDGKLLYAGAGQSWNPLGETADQLTWSERRVYDPAAKRWSVAGQARHGVRSGAASALLRLEPPYDRADILMAGGTFGSTPGTWLATTLAEVVRWTPEGITDGPKSELNQPRWFGTPVTLPTGEVLLLNGGDADDVVMPGTAAAVRAPELYDPRTATWRALAPSSRDRVYHNSAMLLPDGRVLVGGNAPHPAYYFKQGGAPTRSNNFRDATFEIFEPPYLFRGGRPVIKGLRRSPSGRVLKLRLGTVAKARRVSEVVLVRMGANTHAMDGDMRAVELRHKVKGVRVAARLPRGGDGRLLPPGPYYVFAMRETKDGPAPSVAKVVLIQPAADGKVVARRAR